MEMTTTRDAHRRGGVPSVAPSSSRKQRIYWVSKHDPLAVQQDALRKMYGSFEIVQDRHAFDDAADIIERYWLGDEQGHYDLMLVVAPISVLVALYRRGARFLWAKGKKPLGGGRWRFEGFEDFDPNKLVEAGVGVNI